MKTLARQRETIEILERLKNLRPDSVRRWGKMSSHQMVCHLIDACRMMTGEKQVSHATGLPQQTIVKWMALYLPLPWPPGILTRPEIDQEIEGRKPSDFLSDISELETLVRAISAQAKDFERQTHPIFGRMSEAAWLRWAYLHFDHHLRQFGV
jgi:Protein of unknown function (DUF1569)